MNSSYFSKSNTGAVRAVACLTILFSHLTGTMVIKPENPFLFLAQYSDIAVGLFFFYTGYNLLYAPVKKPGEWYQDFWLKKICRIYIPFLILNTISRLLWLFHGEPCDLYAVISCIIGIKLLNPELWYIQGCLLLYIVFYAVFFVYEKRIRRHIQKRWVLALLSILVWVGYCVLYHRYGAFQAKSSYIPWTLLLGMLVSIYGEEILPKWARYKWEVLIFSGFLMIVTVNYIKYNISIPVVGSYALDWTQLRIIIMTVFVNSMIIGENINSLPLAVINKYSLYLYMSHTILYVLWRSVVIFIESDLIYISVYLASVFLTAYLLSKVAETVEKIVRKQIHKMREISIEKG